MRPSLSALISRLSALLLGLGACCGAATPQDSTERFALRGRVVNAATGEPVSRALVQIPGQASQFSDSDGAFNFTGLPRGSYAVEVRKPGFFSDRELGQWNYSLIAIPTREDLLCKLTPEGVVFGEVKHEDGQPAEGVSVKAQRWRVQNGTRQLEVVRAVQTDDQGNFRVADLLPGKYYLSFTPGGLGYTTFSGLKRKTQNSEGYGPQFYPAGADMASASVLDVHAGAQIHIAENMTRQRLFQISGFLRGVNSGESLALTLMTPSGETPQREVHLDPKTGEFQIPGIPAGSYMLSASGARAFRGEGAAESAQLTALLPIHVGGDLSGLVLVLGGTISAPIQLRDEISDAGPGQIHRVFVRMIPQEFPQFGPGIVFPQPPGAPPSAARLENIAPGTYSVEAIPQGPGYVASLRSGNVDLLREDLTIAPGSAPEPIEVTLRNDGAQLNVTVSENRPANGLVIYSPDYPRRSLLIPVNGSPSVSFGALPPGTYQLIALTNVGDLEFRNPSAIEKYLQHATAVTLRPNDNVNVRMETQLTSAEQQ